jgi:hypothetical protein
MLSLCFNWAPCHEGVLGEWRYSTTHSSTLALDGDEWSATCPHCFTPMERVPGTLWIGSWVSPRAVLDPVVKRKIPSPCQELNPRTLITQPIAQHYTDWAITALLLTHASVKIFHFLQTNILITHKFHNVGFLCSKWSKCGKYLSCIKFSSYVGIYLYCLF